MYVILIVWNVMLQILELPGRGSIGILMVMMDNLTISFISYLYTKLYVLPSHMDFIMKKLAGS